MGGLFGTAAGWFGDGRRARFGWFGWVWWFGGRRVRVGIIRQRGDILGRGEGECREGNDEEA